MKTFFITWIFLLISLFGFSQNDERGYIVKIGEMAPDITITYTDGTQKKLSDFRGKIVMLQFTASWCGVCREEMPHIEKEIWQKHRNHSDFALIGIDLKESREQTIKYAKEMQPGKPCVEFQVKGHNGETIVLSEVLKKNKVVLIDFWASWCGACRATMPHLKEVYKKYEHKGFEILCVSLDGEKEKWEKA